MIKVLFVCLGNICRSPTAEGVLKAQIAREGLMEKFHVDSAGTSGWHNGEPPDTRAQIISKNHGVDLSLQKSREINAEDFNLFHYIIAMDQKNLNDLDLLCPLEKKNNLSLLLNYAPEFNRLDIPDPYYHDSFEEVFDMIEVASENFLNLVRKKNKI